MKTKIALLITGLVLTFGSVFSNDANAVHYGGVSPATCHAMDGKWVKVLLSMNVHNPDGSTSTVYYYGYKCDMR